MRTLEAHANSKRQRHEDFHMHQIGMHACKWVLCIPCLPVLERRDSQRHSGVLHLLPHVPLLLRAHLGIFRKEMCHGKIILVSKILCKELWLLRPRVLQSMFSKCMWQIQ